MDLLGGRSVLPKRLLIFVRQWHAFSVQPASDAPPQPSVAAGCLALLPDGSTSVGCAPWWVQIHLCVCRVFCALNSMLVAPTHITARQHALLIELTRRLSSAATEWHWQRPFSDCRVGRSLMQLISLLRPVTYLAGGSALLWKRSRVGMRDDMLCFALEVLAASALAHQSSLPVLLSNVQSTFAAGGLRAGADPIYSRVMVRRLACAMCLSLQGPCAQLVEAMLWSDVCLCDNATRLEIGNCWHTAHNHANGTGQAQQLSGQRGAGAGSSRSAGVQSTRKLVSPPPRCRRQKAHLPFRGRRHRCQHPAARSSSQCQIVPQPTSQGASPAPARAAAVEPVPGAAVAKAAEVPASGAGIGCGVCQLRGNQILAHFQVRMAGVAPSLWRAELTVMLQFLIHCCSHCVPRTLSVWQLLR